MTSRKRLKQLREHPESKDTSYSMYSKINRDEKGRIDPAQSKVALSMRTMAQIAAKQGGHKFGKHAYGEVHHGVSGMDRMATLREANKGKKNKSRVVLRGQKNEYRKAYTKHGTRMRKAGMDLG